MIMEWGPNLLCHPALNDRRIKTAPNIGIPTTTETRDAPFQKAERDTGA